ncbi:MAG: molybdopterin biosynthesis protein MoeB [Bacteroidetes bacterium]|nr:molybdopterin biosynthesis protein MoeB [Bacteroidota bacterium]
MSTKTPHIADEVAFSLDEFRRYGRHLIMPEVGLEGQRKLKSSSVLVVGAGGLGSPVALYLAAAGVGRIGIADSDTVDLTNLQRQILHSTEDLGQPKTESAGRRLRNLNPEIEIEMHRARLSSENALDILKDFDVVVDGTDNFPSRYLLNDACVLLGKPNVYGSIFRFEGQVSVFDAEDGPCYRCVYPEPPPPGLVPSCAEGGVLGVLPGIIGTLQASEVIKLLLGIGESLMGRMLLFDALKVQFRELKIRKDPKCPVCGENPTIRELIDYDAFCGYDSRNAGKNEAEISVEELRRRLDNGDDILLLDVREPVESEIVTIGGILMPLRDLPGRVRELDSAREIVAYCHHGERSQRAVALLKELGFKKAKNLAGGIDQWACVVDKTLSRY